jgi:hypothetical protein
VLKSTPSPTLLTCNSLNESTSPAKSFELSLPKLISSSSIGIDPSNPSSAADVEACVATKRAVKGAQDEVRLPAFDGRVCSVKSWKEGGGVERSFE